jgi:SAM-dependent methyltransferase
VQQAPAHRLDVPPRSFASAFANCSLEHMDALPEVLRAVHGALQPGGTFLFSVVTDRFITWSLVPLLLRKLGLPDRAAALQKEHEHYHHLVNPFTPERWAGELHAAGFAEIVHVPIVPELTGRLFVLLDQLWHVPQADGRELGQDLHAYFASLPNFVAGHRDLLAALLRMEAAPGIGAGAVFAARRPA